MIAGEVAARQALPELKLKLALAGVDLEQRSVDTDLPEPELASNSKVVCPALDKSSMCAE